MIENNESAKAGRDRLKEIVDPRRVTLRLGADTLLRLRHGALDLGETGISRLIEAACRLWLEREGLDSSE